LNRDRRFNGCVFCFAIAPNADATITMTKPTLDRINLRQVNLKSAMETGEIKVEGDNTRLGELMSMMTIFDPSFGLAAPSTAR